jgi:rubrerythrin
MKSLKGSQTEKNILTMFAGESQARNRYSLYAKVARKEGHELIARVFEETAGNEFIHAEELFEKLEGRPVEITATYPAGKLGTTLENLADAAKGEHEEWTDAYPSFAKVAQEEGYPEIAALFTSIGRVEKEHEARYIKIHDLLAKDELYKRVNKTTWRCLNCGCQVTSTNAPIKCPICGKVHTWFEDLDDRLL